MTSEPVAEDTENESSASAEDEEEKGPTYVTHFLTVNLNMKNGSSFTANGSKGKTHHCVYVGSKTDLVINGGIFAHNGAGISDSGATITVYAGANGGATINGGTFTGSGTYIAPFDKYDSNCYFVINGGYVSKDPTK